MERSNRIKRDQFITEAVKILQDTANKMGYGRISKETLALMLQRYNQTYNPPKYPCKRRKQPKLVVIKNEP